MYPILKPLRPAESCEHDHITEVLTVIFKDRLPPALSTFDPAGLTPGLALDLCRALIHSYGLTVRSLIATKILISQCENKSEAHGEGFIYLLEADEGAFYKIGRTVDLSSRIKTFGVQLPFKVSVRHSFRVPDMACAELAMHEYFKDRRMNGEWFSLSPHDVESFCLLPVLE